MSEPQADDVAGALTRLEEQVTELHDEVRRLGVASPLPASIDEPVMHLAPGSYAWVGALDAPVRRRPQVPRLLLEGLFLAAAAAAAAIADLDPVAIGGVMIGAWVLVALIEWAASRADRRQELPVHACSVCAPWSPIRRGSARPSSTTLLEGAAGDSDTRSRASPRLDDAEATVEQRL
jgi:hypothetical protein